MPEADSKADKEYNEVSKETCSFICMSETPLPSNGDVANILRDRLRDDELLAQIANEHPGVVVSLFGLVSAGIEVGTKRGSLLDSLTEEYGVYNPRGLETMLHQRAERWEQNPNVFDRQRVLTVMADVNGLKEVNDTSGHAAGNHLLRQAANVLTKAVKTEDIVARVGGDEFGMFGIVNAPKRKRSQLDEIVQKAFDRIEQEIGSKMNEVVTQLRQAFPNIPAQVERKRGMVEPGKISLGMHAYKVPEAIALIKAFPSVGRPGAAGAGVRPEDTLVGNFFDPADQNMYSRRVRR